MDSMLVVNFFLLVLQITMKPENVFLTGVEGE